MTRTRTARDWTGGSPDRTGPTCCPVRTAISVPGCSLTWCPPPAGSTNVRTCVSSQDWERLRRMITRRAEQKCEACGADEDRVLRRRLEVDEGWAYDDHTGV